MDRRRFWVNVVAAGVGALLTLGVALSSHLYLQSMGILLISAAMFLRPRTMSVVAAAFLFVAMALILALDLEEPWIRAMNATLAAALSIMISVIRQEDVRTVDLVLAQESAVLASCGDAIVVVSADGTLQRANPAAAAMLPPGAIGSPLHELLEHRLADGRPCPGGCSLAGVPSSERGGTTTIRTPKGRRHVESVASPIDADLTVISIRDVSERVAADEDRRALVASALRLREQSRRVAAFGNARGAVDTDLPGVELDLWSVPAGPNTASGSDLVDVSRMPDGRIAFLLVDGLDEGGLTAEESWTVLYVTRGLLFAGIALEELVERSALTLAAQHHEPKASVLAGTFDPASGRTAVAAGGHPPPLVVRSTGAVEWLASGGAPVGVPQHEPKRRTAETVLLPGDRLVLYTDGVIDGQKDLLAGLSALQSAATARRSIRGDGWSRSLLEAVLPSGSPADNATVLALSRTPANGQTADTLAAVLPRGQ
jgi:PAS domain-containing protein